MGGANLIPQFEGAVSGRYKYLRYLEQTPLYEQLFDLESNPHEEMNLVAEPAHQREREAMWNRWQELQYCVPITTLLFRPSQYFEEGLT